MINKFLSFLFKWIFFKTEIDFPIEEFIPFIFLGAHA